MHKHAWLAPLLAGLAFGATAHEGAKHASAPAEEARKEQKDWGIAGDARSVTRTIEVTMTDKMRFAPRLIEVNEGETIRFVHRNAGRIMHEFVLGTKKDLDEHAALMAKYPKMEHDEPYMAHVRPGGAQNMVWHFNRPGVFDFGCLIPGHYQSGMVGRIIVKPRAEAEAKAKAKSNGKL